MIELVTCCNRHMFVRGNSFIGGRDAGNSRCGWNCREAVFDGISEGIAESKGINLPKREKLRDWGKIEGISHERRE